MPRRKVIKARDYLDASTEALLIEEVQARPIFYQTTHEKYKNTYAKAQVWQQIAERLGITG